jgi:torulene dioxygenase
MHLPKDKNPLSRGTASQKPEEEEACVAFYLHLDRRTDISK